VRALVGLDWSGWGVGGRGKVKGNSYCIINPKFIHIHTYTHTHTQTYDNGTRDLQCTITAILPSFDSEDGAFVLASYRIASQRSHGHRMARKRASMHTRDKRKESTTQKEKGNTKKRKKDTSIKPPELSSPSCLYVNHSIPVGKPKPDAKIIPIAQVALR